MIIRNWLKIDTFCGVKAVPVGGVGGIIGKRNIAYLDGARDGRADAGGTVQISEMSSTRHQRGILTIAQIGPIIEQSVGGAGRGNRVNRRVCGRYGEGDGDGSAAGDLIICLCGKSCSACIAYAFFCCEAV